VGTTVQLFKVKVSKFEVLPRLAEVEVFQVAVLSSCGIARDGMRRWCPPTVRVLGGHRGILQDVR
jgi:hypothetical protein